MDKKSKKKWFGPTKIKRLFDICASFLALVVLSPLVQRFFVGGITAGSVKG